MSECQKQKLKVWIDDNNGHPCDNSLFYDLVIDTLDNKIGELDFDEVIEGEKAIECFKRYEDLRNCLLYYKSHNR